MQLIHLQGENFMRFERVDLKFPEKGLFCIQGANESGKSSLGNMVMFAFSGAGFKGETPESLINWEKNQMKVNLVFAHNGERYELTRQVDRDGSNFSKMSKNGEVLAHGITGILEVLRQTLRYCPKDLGRSFYITHRIVQNLAHESCDRHLDYMLGLDRLAEMAKVNGQSGGGVGAELDKEISKEKRLKDEQRSLGYDEEKLDEAKAQLSTVREELEAVQLTLEQARGDVSVLRATQDQLEKLKKQCPSNWDVDQAETLERTVEATAEAIAGLQVRSDKKDRLKPALETLAKVTDYSKEFRALLKKIEANLEQLRHQIGNDAKEGDKPSKTSLLGQETFLQTSFDKKSGTASKLGLLGGLMTIASILMVGAVVLRPQFWSVIRTSGLWDLFHGGPLEQLRLRLESLLASETVAGYPAHFLPWGGLIVCVLTAITAFILAGRFSMAKALLLEKLSGVSDEKKQVEKTYHALLSVDVREMSELHTVIMDDGNDELKEALKTLLSHHEDVVESDYQLDQMLLNAMEQVDSFANDLGLQAHQHQQRIEEWSEQRNALEEKVAKAEDRCQSLEEKKEKFSSMFADIDASGRLVHQLQRRRTISKYIVELAEGTLVSVRSRLSRDLTMAFKECMPQVTSGRYASVRFGEGFHIEVFNEDRGDFVPLHQLSSGTNDLFVLIFQLVLLRGFMESRQLSSHFIFLDEPLLAVDGDRYAKLTSLLPKISSGLDQIFLCRPPEDQENAYILNTALDQTELVADLTQG